MSSMPCFYLLHYFRLQDANIYHTHFWQCTCDSSHNRVKILVEGAPVVGKPFHNICDVFIPHDSTHSDAVGPVAAIWAVPLRKGWHIAKPARDPRLRPWILCQPQLRAPCIAYIAKLTLRRHFPYFLGEQIHQTWAGTPRSYAKWVNVNSCLGISACEP
jgi:hypothetical protein